MVFRFQRQPFGFRATLLLLLGIHLVASDDLPPINLFQFHPIRIRLGMMQTAAEASLAVYTDEKPSDAVDFWIATNAKESIQRSAALWTQDESYCYFAFRGGPTAEQGFQWVANINMKVSRAKTIARPRWSCRVLREYNELVRQTKRNTKGQYRSELINAVDTCVSTGRRIVLTGHDIGGAIATVWGVALFAYVGKKDHPWVVTFGSPPVFSPKVYSGFDVFTPGELDDLGGLGLDGLPDFILPRPGNQVPCRFLKYEKTVQFVNTEFSLYLDFMYSLNVMMYAMMQNDLSRYHLEEFSDPESSRRLNCLIQGAFRVQRFFGRGETGNLGSPYGQFIFLAPSMRNDFFRRPGEDVYWTAVPREVKRSFSNSFYNLPTNGTLSSTFLLLPDSCRLDEIDEDPADGGAEIHCQARLIGRESPGKKDERGTRQSTTTP